ncbi:hypothetical protein D3C81_1960600 [compost metagenome]
MSSRPSSRHDSAMVMNSRVKASAILPRKCWAVSDSSGTSFSPNWMTSDGVVCARR